MAGPNDIDYAGLTDVGVRRSHNQDSFAILPATDRDQWRTRGHLFLVADGMCAHAVGELASKLATDNIPHLYSKHAQDGAHQALRRAFLETNSTIHNRGQQNRDFEGMGTTSTALVLRPEGAWVGHVGDSRVYRVRDGRLDQLSFDHSLVWEMARRQKCSPDDLPGIPSNVIVRSLGPEPLVQVDVEGPHPVQPGDVFVLCSDGLSGPVSDQEIGAVAAALPPAEASQLLVDLANLHGGPDNITALVIRVTAADESRDETPPGPAGGRPPQPWYERYPWALLTLTAGTLLAALAILLTVNQIPGSYAAFTLAALAMLVGLAGLAWQFTREKQQPEELPAPRPVKVYRQTPCAVEPTLLEKLRKAQSQLEDRVRDQGWTVDWGRYRQHAQKAEEMAAQERPVDAFRETCRALRILTETVQRQRNKEEVFQPLWEKKSARHS